jgi:tungstate transport system ATP-binding protein
MGKLIELSNITVRSNGKIILSIPHAMIPSGQIVACIGPNGSGKTTLLKVVAGLIQPDSGAITRSIKATRTALVLHHTPMIRASCRTNLSMVKDADSSITDTDIDAALADTHLTEHATRPATQLSAGERQKLSIGRAILQKPDLILLDEPTANLDPSSSEQVEDLIRKLKHRGSEILFSSHQLTQVQRLAQYIIFIDEGQIKEIGAVADFFSHPQTSAAQRYLKYELANS